MYAGKDALDHPEFYAGKPAPGRRVSVAPAETEVTEIEQKARDAYSGELDSRADAILDPETSREMRSLVQRVKTAIPVLEFCERLRKIDQAKADLGQVTGLELITLRGGLDESAAELRRTQVYPPVLLDMVERYQDWGPGKVNPADYLAGDVSESDWASVAAACELLGLNAEKKSRPSRPLSKEQVQARVEKAVSDRLAGLGIEVQAMRRELDSFKAEQAAHGARFR